MRQKTKVKEKFSAYYWIFISSGYLLISILLIFHLVNYFLRLYEIYNILPTYKTEIWQEIFILIGAPVTLIFSLILSFKFPKFCGALLLLGSALISTGIAFESGYYLRTYLLKMALIGLPQILAAIFFF